jgi:hypothetical protein
VPVDKEHIFETAGGRRTLAELGSVSRQVVSGEMRPLDSTGTAYASAGGGRAS